MDKERGRSNNYTGSFTEGMTRDTRIIVLGDTMGVLGEVAGLLVEKEIRLSGGRFVLRLGICRNGDIISGRVCSAISGWGWWRRRYQTCPVRQGP